MTEAEWLECADPRALLECLRGKESDRKVRLLLCGWSRLNWKWLPKQCCSAVEVAELFADGLVSDSDRRSADAELWWITQGGNTTIRNWLARSTLEGSIDLWQAADAFASSNPKVKNKQTAILRDIVGNLICAATIDPIWLAYNDGPVAKLAQTIYNERAFDRMPILADALEDAGCDHAAILDHCRTGVVHVRGCWVVDLLLGKD